jgi:hypothetical protein
MPKLVQAKKKYDVLYKPKLKLKKKLMKKFNLNNKKRNNAHLLLNHFIKMSNFRFFQSLMLMETLAETQAKAVLFFN